MVDATGVASVEDGAAGALAVLEMITGSWMSQAIYAAARLGIADALADGPRSSAALATALGADGDSLHRLLRALVALGLCAERDAGVFELTPLGTHLRAGAPASVRSFALHWGGTMWPLWGGLLHSVKTGRALRGLVSRKDPFDSLARDSEAVRSFNDAMTEISRLVADGVARAHDFSGIRRIVDVGGGHGELLAAILGTVPSVRGVLLDLPHVLEGARALLAAAGLAERCELVPGSFFDSIPSGGDRYLLKSVLHDWDDERARTILTNCRHAMAGRGTLVVVERIVPDRMSPSPEHRFVAASDLGMMVATAGRERTEAEFRALFAASGFALTRTAPAAAHYSVIEGACA